MLQTKNTFAGFFRKTALYLSGLTTTLFALFIINNNKGEYTGELPFWSVVVILSATLVLLLGLAYFAHTFYTRCPHCKKKMAMQTQSKQQIGVDYEHKKDGGKVRTYKITTYNVHRKCKFCNGEDYVEETKKKECR